MINTQIQPHTMAAVVPQKPITLFSSVDRRFMPKMPATIAPSAAAKLPMLSVSSRRLTCKHERNVWGLNTTRTLL